MVKSRATGHPQKAEERTLRPGKGNGNGGGGGNNGNGHAGGNGRGLGHGQGKEKGPKRGLQVGPDLLLYPETLDYLLNPSSEVRYTYDTVGNHLSHIDDYGTVSYQYDANNRLLGYGDVSFEYDADGNRIAKTDSRGTVSYRYRWGDKLAAVEYADGTSVRYGYDAFGRKSHREEDYFQFNGPRSVVWQHDVYAGLAGTGRRRPVRVVVQLLRRARWWWRRRRQRRPAPADAGADRGAEG